MIDVSINGRGRICRSAADFAPLLDELRRLPGAEVWLSTDGGPQLCLLRSGADAMLMFLSHQDGDTGLVSLGDTARRGTFTVVLANGQRDEYPAAYAVPLDEALRALAHFIETGGEPAPFIQWHSEVR